MTGSAESNIESQTSLTARSTQQEDKASDEEGPEVDGDVVVGEHRLGTFLHKPSHLLHADTGHQIYKKKTLSLSLSL